PIYPTIPHIFGYLLLHQVALYYLREIFGVSTHLLYILALYHYSVKWLSSAGSYKDASLAIKFLFKLLNGLPDLRIFHISVFVLVFYLGVYKHLRIYIHYFSKLACLASSFLEHSEHLYGRYYSVSRSVIVMEYYMSRLFSAEGISTF